MSLFDRLRPKWKHADPAIRMAAVRELADQEILARLSEEDPSEEVRLAAVETLTDQEVLVGIAIGNTPLAIAAVQRLTNPAAIARVALGGAQAVVRARAVERTDDAATLHRVAGFDPDAGVRSRARARSAGSHHARLVIREALTKLPIADGKASETAEFSGTLDAICHALVQDPRFTINGDVVEDDHAEFSPKGADGGAAETPRVTAATSPRVVARFLAQSRGPGAGAPKLAPSVRFYQIKVWRTQTDEFGAVAEEKNLAMTNNAVAWSQASNGKTQPMAVIRPAGG